MAYTCARSTRLEDERPCQGKRMPPYSYRRPWGAGGSMAGIRHLGRGGLCGAVRHGPGCRSAWRPLEPARAQGARYALEVLEDVCGGEGGPGEAC